MDDRPPRSSTTRWASSTRNPLTEQDATVSGGGLLVQAGGPVAFNGISAYQNQFVDSLVNELSTRLNLDAKA